MARDVKLSLATAIKSYDLIACSYFSFTSRAIVETDDNTHEIGSLGSALRVFACVESII